MVYRGKPSAGCENCRKAKKRCGLEQPSCERCVKLKKICSGYRDTTALQIQDESESVRQKVERQKPKPSSSQPPAPFRQLSPPKQVVVAHHLAPPTITDTVIGIPTPGSIHSDSTNSTSSSDTIELDRDASMSDSLMSFAPDIKAQDETVDVESFNQWSPNLSFLPQPKPDELATTYFFNEFTTSYHWQFLKEFAAGRTLDPCLDFAIKACGIAALSNLQKIHGGREYGRSMYTSALGLLNEQLRDSKRCRTDESLIAVSLLGRYENLTCDGRESIQSWKAHIKGSTQLLRVRGRAQFRTAIGRLMYREMRSQMMINAIWEDESIPSFFREFQEALESYPVTIIDRPIEDITQICFDFADLRANIRLRRISDAAAAEEAGELERRFIQWSISTMAYHEMWAYTTIDVDDSEHVWDGKVHSFYGLPAPTVWNSYRNMRIMLSRTQEWLCRRLQFSDAEREEQMYYLRRTRRQLTDDICATVPVALGHGSPAYSSPCPLLSSYGTIWPLFFAGTCALERVGKDAWPIVKGEPLSHGARSNKAAAQALWIMGRLDYISKHIGLKWADGVAAVLRGDFKVSQRMIDDEHVSGKVTYTRAQRAMWLKTTEGSEKARRAPIDSQYEVSDAITKDEADFDDPEMWPGRIPPPYPQIPNERSMHVSLATALD